MSWARGWSVLGCLIALAGCAGDDGAPETADGLDGADGSDGTDGSDGADGTAPDGEWGVIDVDPDATPPDLLSTLQLVRWTGADVEYNAGVVPYALRTPLFSDFARKRRAIWMPEGAAAAWPEAGTLDFPVGTVLLKTFIHVSDHTRDDSPLQVVETRVLMLGSEGWSAWPYLWRADGTDADLHLSGKVMALDLIDPDGNARTAQYLVPQRNQCVDCHESLDADGESVLGPIGPSPRFLHDGLLLEQLVADGQLTGAPDLTTLQAATDWASIEAADVSTLAPEVIEDAARSYLHINCAHCHSPNGIEGVTSQFFLNYDQDDPFHLGVCKRPGSAGSGGVDREFDVVPGDPEQSILWYRTATENVGAMMPDLGRSLGHDVGAAVIWRWIEDMPPVDCEAVDAAR